MNQQPQILSLGIIILFCGTIGCQEDLKAPPMATLPTAEVRVEPVEREKVLLTEEVVGTVRAKVEARIEAKVSARIEDLLVAPGTKVAAGDLLIELDDREIKARLDQAIAQRDQYARDTERLRNLLSLNAVSRQDFETAQSRHQVAMAAVQEAETMLGYTKVIAPFDGVITRKLADVGDLASPGKPLLQIENPSVFRFEADVPEGLVAHVAGGAKLRVEVTGLPEMLGEVTEIAPAADPASRTFLVKLDLPEKPGLRTGLFGRVAIPAGEALTLRVPRSAVVERGQLEMVFVAVAGKAEMRIVKTGRRFGDQVELVSGVEAGESVIIEGGEKLRDGQPLEIAS